MAACSEISPPYAKIVRSSTTSQKVNIEGGDDPYYRYKTHQLLCRTNKMNRTYFLNLNQVGKDLHLPPAYIPAWLAYSFGSSFKYNPSLSTDQQGSISGTPPIKKISLALRSMIKEIVICQKCHLPELTSRIKKSRGLRVMLRCSSCGAYYPLSSSVPSKFEKYMINHPPPQPRWKKRRSTKPKKASSSEIFFPSSSESVIWHLDTSEKAIALRQKELAPEKVLELLD